MKEKSNNRRQIYIWDENKEFYDNLKNKSGLINKLIQNYINFLQESEDGQTAK